MWFLDLAISTVYCECAHFRQPLWVSDVERPRQHLGFHVVGGSAVAGHRGRPQALSFHPRSTCHIFFRTHARAKDAIRTYRRPIFSPGSRSSSFPPSASPIARRPSHQQPSWIRSSTSPGRPRRARARDAPRKRARRDGCHVEELRGGL